MNYPHTLNVVFHGLWAYEIGPSRSGRDAIVVRTPPESDHRVAAGGWIPHADLKEGSTYDLNGVDEGTDTTFDEATNAIFRKRKLVADAEVRCTIRLPIPKYIRSLRPITLHKDKPPYLGSDAHLIMSREIAIVQVFVYKANLPDVRLVEVDQAARRPHEVRLPGINAGQSIANFYVFAQPDGRVPGNHFETAFAKLAALYGLDIVPVPSMPAGPQGPNPPIAGFMWRDLVGLNERATYKGELLPAAGSSGAHCDPFIVDNREGAHAGGATQSSGRPRSYSRPGKGHSPRKKT
jgi:hypothetical protein